MEQIDQESRQAAQVTLQFLRRSQLVGDDVDSFVASRNWLRMIASGALLVSMIQPAPQQPQVSVAAPSVAVPAPVPEPIPDEAAELPAA